MLVVLLTACVSAQEPIAKPYIPIPLDPVFQSYYDDLGGEKLLGEVISVAREIGNAKTQFVANGLLFYDPQAVDGSQVRLWAVGNEMGIEEPAIRHPEYLHTGDIFLNGHVITEEFASFFSRLGGARVVGNPLTELVYSPVYRRYEQYFENLGFYRMESAPAGDVQFLAYGTWACKDQCQSLARFSSTVDIHLPIEVEFQVVLDKCGIDFTGYQLDGFSHESENGQYLEAVFKNVAMKIEPAEGKDVQMLPVPLLVGVRPSALSLPSNDPDFVFIPIKGEHEGINVHKDIYDFVMKNGGSAIAGPPLTSFQEYGKLFRQCFTNICLLYDPDATPWRNVYPEPLGYTYLKIHHREGIELLPSGGPDKQEKVQHGDVNTIIETNEEYPSISTREQQKIYIKVFDRSGRGLPGKKTSLTISIPDAGEVVFSLPDTDIRGEIWIEIPAIIAPQGTLIPYKACVETSLGMVCKLDSYVIWSGP